MRYVSVFLILALCLCLFAGCGRNTESARSMLEARMARLDGLPNGEVYSFRMGENGNVPLSPEQILSLYGEEAERNYFPLIEEYAIYLSSGLPCEIAVLRCYARSDVDAVARMCLRRSELLRRILGHSDLYERVSDICITIEGRTVIMTVAAREA